MVGLDDEIFLISSGGHTVRTAVRDISSQGRDASGKDGAIRKVPTSSVPRGANGRPP